MTASGRTEIASGPGRSARERFRSLPSIVMWYGVLPLAVLLCLVPRIHASLDLDETVSVMYAQANWRWFWDQVGHDANMAFYYTLLHWWTNAVIALMTRSVTFYQSRFELGTSPFTVRLVSVLPAVAAVGVIYLLGRRLYDARVGVLAALFLCLNAFFLEYAQDARSYSLVLFLVTTSSYLWVRAIEDPTVGRWVAYVATSALAIYSHFFAALVVAAQCAALGSFRGARSGWRWALLSVAGVGILALPLVAFVIFRNSGQESWVPGLSVDTVSTIANLTGGMPWLDPIGGGALIAAYAALIAVAAMETVRRGQSRVEAPPAERPTQFLLAWLIVPVALTILVSIVSPVFVARYFIVVLPPIVLLVARGGSRLRPRWLGALTLLVVIALMVRSVVFYHSRFEAEDWSGATGYVATHARPGEALLLYAPYVEIPYQYYAARLRRTELPRVVFPARPEDEHARTLRQLDLPRRLVCSQGVWLVLSHAHYSGDTFGDAIEAYLTGERGQPVTTAFSAILVKHYGPCGM